jgi:EAL and modified HD-GYP domain-containing signal transduction protein
MAFINFTKNLLLDGFATYFSPKNIAIEVLEATEPSPELLEELRILKSQGYTIALDDFAYRPALKSLLPLADIVKIDFLENVFTMRNFYAICSHINLSKCKLLAEKVENQTVYEKARDLGCQLFQGYFFAKPSILSEKTVSVTGHGAMRLIAEASREPVDFDEIAKIIKYDIALTYKILRLANSAFFGSLHEITDIKRAVIFIGQKELKKWVSYVALTNMTGQKPPELIEMSMVRARFCELTAEKTGMRIESDAFFLAGLFSLLEVMLDSNFETILKDVPLPSLTQEALLGGKGIIRDAIDLIVALEQGKWDDASRLCATLGISNDDVNGQYADSLKWTADLNPDEN